MSNEHHNELNLVVILTRVILSIEFYDETLLIKVMKRMHELNYLLNNKRYVRASNSQIIKTLHISMIH